MSLHVSKDVQLRPATNPSESHSTHSICNFQVAQEGINITIGLGAAVMMSCNMRKQVESYLVPIIWYFRCYLDLVPQMQWGPSETHDVESFSWSEPSEKNSTISPTSICFFGKNDEKNPSTKHNTHFSLSQWTLEKKVWTLFCLLKSTKYVIPKKFKPFSHWPSKTFLKWTHLKSSHRGPDFSPPDRLFNWDDHWCTHQIPS